jgi:hypothetical protein
LHPRVIRRFHLTLLAGSVVGSLAVMALIALGIGRLINPLLLGYLFLLGFILLGMLEIWEPRSEEREGQGAPEDGTSAEALREGSDSGRTDG